MSNTLPRQHLSATARIGVDFLAIDGATRPRSGSGSGFWVNGLQNGRTKVPYFVFITNRHVVDYWYGSRKCGYRLSDVRLQSFDLDGNPFPILELEARDISIKYPENEKLDIAVLTCDYDPLGSFLKSSLPSQIVTISNSHLISDERKSRDLPWGAHVSFVSFQPWADSAVGRPILRSGIVASDPRHDYNLDEINREDVLLLEAMSFAGSSGSLVIANSEGDTFRDDFSGPGVRPYRPEQILGIMSGHIRNKRDDIGEFYNMHTGPVTSP